MKSPSIYPLGDTAAVVEFGGGISAATMRRIAALGQQLVRQPLPGLRETVPAYTTLTVFYDPACAYEQVAAWLRNALTASEAAPNTPVSPPEVVEIPVCYGGEYGPDLAAVAAHTGLEMNEVITRHAAPTYLVHLLGFLPGFPYLGVLDAQLTTPRRASPRARVPAGAVGIAGAQTGIYPLASPGGWQLIGRTPLRLFDPAWPEPTRLRAGQQLRFVPISATEFEKMRQMCRYKDV
ncbi:5-oxoprolinase subunit PxpB [Hymenobacter sp. RP-2-7]|uniref:5-oxoprolinase subunit PxpB n=1 Tax=Hymenobacter polaris TaxID=2682546 RepID=A0A7Y0AGZ7_9BACT|nr:5-oxoprolinase subunit PxpB [Hymenobacter polaris]NML67162.1 5-oxoprolinase subunit PxpB [Hymenobacter polaris]